MPGCLISNPIKSKQSKNNKNWKIKKKTPVIISLSQPKKPDKEITMKHLRVFFFALLLLASPLLQGNITVSSSHFLDPDPDLHALAKRILFCSWTLSVFFFFSEILVSFISSFYRVNRLNWDRSDLVIWRFCWHLDGNACADFIMFML